jgi:ribosomal protein S18 acetylase RimI-like enzyme
MQKSRYAVSKLAPNEERAAVAALARSFFDDAMFSWVAPDPIRRSHMLEHLMRASVADSRPFGEMWVARPAPGSDAAGALAAGALWLPPDAYPRGTRRDLGYVARAWRGTPGIGRRVPAMLRLLNKLDAVHPHEPHWYLAVLGTDPLFQRTGAGTALLEPVLARSDAEGLPAYLETQKEANLAWYGRFGFDVVERIEVGAVPPIWTMQRAPRAAS